MEIALDAKMWDEKYASMELVWNLGPNQSVRNYFTDKKAGHIVDLGCGEGRNAIWLAQQGWTVTAVDFSSVALSKALALSQRAGVTLALEHADLTQWESASPSFDAALLCYIHFPAAVRAKLWRSAYESLVPGGELVIIGHHVRNLTEGVGGPQTADVLYTPSEVVEVLGAGNVVLSEDVLRTVDSPLGPKVAIDAMAVVRRPSQ